MRKALDIQAFLEYSMVVENISGYFMPVPFTSALRYSKIVHYFIAGGLSLWTGFLI